jgi:putative Holliday junction resolvase
LENGELNLRILGLDYGSKTVGVAVSDSLCLTAQAVETITRNSENKLRRTLARIEALVKEYEVSLIVLGLPLLWNNDMAERAQETAIFRDMLERRTGLKVVYQDERLTTDEAERTLIESGIRRENRKKYIDQIAAVLILQSYLDRINNQEK